MCQFFASGGQSIGVWASASVLPMNTQDTTEQLNGLISFRIVWFDLLEVTGEMNGKPLQYSCLENPMNSMKRQEGFSQFSSVAQSCPTLCDLTDCSTPGFPVLHHLPEFALTHVCWSGDAIQLSHPLLSPSPPAFNPPQHQSLLQWVSSSHQVAKVFEFQLQHQSFLWVIRTDFLYDWPVWSPCSPRDSQESSPTLQFKSIHSSVLKPDSN